jgi:hypothetical protein
MTTFGMYDRQTRPMMNLELARIIQADREREIQSALRTRRLLRKDDVDAARRTAGADRRPAGADGRPADADGRPTDADGRPADVDRRPVHRPASTGATSR